MTCVEIHDKESPVLYVKYRAFFVLQAASSAFISEGFVQLLYGLGFAILMLCIKAEC